jgi:hypothetical protein
MPDETPGPTPSQIPEAKPHGAQRSAFNIGEEFGTAKRNLPPVRILLAALGGVLVLAGIVAFLQRAKPQAAGTLVNVSAVQIPAQNAVLVALTFTLRNPGEKSLWVHGIQGKLAGPGGELISDAVSAVDFDRYYSAFPALKVGVQPALSPEDKLAPGEQINRTVIVSFPVTIDVFNQRKSISVIVQPYDQPLPVVVTG